MEKLEHYLDQVCRSIGGPRALRQHIRQELREHLLDAAAEYKRAGLPEEEALNRALEDFGGPEEVRSELEATHGHRLLPVVIDKAMQWKERTMRAKWLWTTWAYLTAGLVIVLQVLFITFNGMYILPKFQKLTRDGILDPVFFEDQGLSWMMSFWNGLLAVGRYTMQILLVALAAWGLFEWRVKSENKPFIRLSVLGTTAVGLMVVVVLLSGSLVISFFPGVPAMGRMVRPWTVQQVAAVDTSVHDLEQALTEKDWQAMQKRVDQAADALHGLMYGPALHSLVRWNEAPTHRQHSEAVEELRAHVKAASDHLTQARQAIREKDEEQLKTALRKFHQSYERVLEAAK